MIKHNYLPFEYENSPTANVFDGIVFTENFGKIKKGDIFQWCEVFWTVVCCWYDGDIKSVEFEIKTVKAR